MNSKVIGQAVGLGVVFAVIGLAVGYAVFGKLAGEYVDLDVLLAVNRNALEKAIHSVAGVNAMRTKILWCGLAGFVAGAVARIFFGVKAK